jgi:ribosomal protein S10
MTNNKLIKLYSKDKNSLKRFILLLQKINRKWKNLTFVSKSIKKRRKKITILKSPHVNKKAQTQYQTITYGTSIKYSTLEIKKNDILLKKIKNHLFPGVKMKIERTVLSNQTQIKNQFLPKKVYYYNNKESQIGKQKQKNNLLDFKNHTETKRVLLQKTLQYIKMLDHYGKI